MKVMYTRKCLTAGCDAATVFNACRGTLRACKQVCPSSTVSADLGFNLGLHGDRPATNRSNPVTASETICTVFREDS
jgi:hypothetical protein